MQSSPVTETCSSRSQKLIQAKDYCKPTNNACCCCCCCNLMSRFLLYVYVALDLDRRRRREIVDRVQPIGFVTNTNSQMLNNNEDTSLLCQQDCRVGKNRVNETCRANDVDLHGVMYNDRRSSIIETIVRISLC